MAAESNTNQESKPTDTSDILEVKAVGPNTISAISIMGEKEQLAGNVLRRLCKLGNGACKEVCALHQGIIERAQANIDAKCADENLVQVISALGTKPENVYMVGVTADGVGFADEIDSDKSKYPYKVNPATHVKELAGFNAFFAREGDTIDGDEVVALGRRLADCGDVNLEFADKDGKKVMGFMHMTKTNLQGESAVKYDYQGKKVGSFEYFLRSAMDHYGADISSINIRVAAAIRPENYSSYKFKNEAHIDDPKEGFPGWKDMFNEKRERFLRNNSNSEWKPGDLFEPDDRWTIDFEAMLRWQMSRVKELQSEQINWDSAIDAGDKGSPHASNTRGRVNPDINGRDAYFTVWKDKLEN